MRTLRHILLGLAAVLLLFSCSGKARIIPRGAMTSIYAEMFLADQWLEDHPAERSRVDTMLFYDPIFKRYGYTFEDFDLSVRHYLKDPEKFSKIFRDAGTKLKSRREVYHKQLEKLEFIRDFNASIKGYRVKDFKEDTLLWRTPYKDSMRIAAIRRDSLFRDSLYRDSLIRDSLRLDSLRLDSLKNLRKLKIKYSGVRQLRNVINQ